jgi:hypothetical protein
MVLLTVVVHPIDTAAHPTNPPGYRWALMLGDGPPEQLDRCANAHWAPTRAEAETEGDRNGASAARVLQMLGQSARYGGVQHLDHDPIPAGADRLNII